MLNLPNQIAFIEALTPTSNSSKNQFSLSNDKLFCEENFLNISKIQKRSYSHLYLNTFQKRGECAKFTHNHFQSPTILLNNIPNLDQQKNQKICSKCDLADIFNPSNNEKIIQKSQILYFQIGLLKKQNQLLKQKLNQFVRCHKQSLIVLSEELRKMHIFQQKQTLRKEQKYFEMTQQKQNIRLLDMKRISQIQHLSKSLIKCKEDYSLLLKEIKQEREKSLKQLIKLKQELLLQTKLNKSLEYDIFELKQKVDHYQRIKNSCKCMVNSINQNYTQHSQNAYDKISVCKKQLFKSETNPQNLSIGFLSCKVYSQQKIIQECTTQSCKQIPNSFLNTPNKLEKFSSQKQTRIRSQYNISSNSKLQEQLSDIKMKIKLAKQQVLFNKE